MKNYWERKERWCMAYRSAEMCGHSTNNYTETAVRLYKDIVLSRCKAYNITASVDFTTTTMEKYYCHRLLKFAHSRVSTLHLLMKKQLTKSSYLSFMDIIQVSPAQFFVPSEKDATILYEVDTKVGACSCTSGKYGRFCKHEAAIYRLFNTTLPNAPALLPQDRSKVAYIALGKDAKDHSFYEDLVPMTVRKNECQSGSQNLDVISPTKTHASTSILPEKYKDSTNEVLDINSNIVVGETKQSTNPSTISQAFEELKILHDKFGTSQSGIDSLLKRAKTIKNKGQWESFVHGVHIHRYKSGASIHTQPTSRARRRAGVTKGSKRLAVGRPAQGDTKCRKRRRKLQQNISKNLPNAKGH